MREIVIALVIRGLERLAQEGVLPPELARAFAERSAEFKVERPREKTHGDFSTNAALVLARQAGMKPRDLAQRLLDAMAADPASGVRCTIAGPGFLNFYLSEERLRQLIPQILQLGSKYGQTQVGTGERILVEFVSANPTGPMHVGHGRGAVTGDAIARLFAAIGCQVEREYYINDAGTQIDVLGRSVLFRYRECLGYPASAPADYYPGEYVTEIARALIERDGERWLSASERDGTRATLERPPEAVIDFAIDWVMQEIRADLELMQIRFDRWFSERSLHREGGIERALSHLSQQGWLYEGVLEPPKGREVNSDEVDGRKQLLFRASRFGDDADRPLLKADGTPTYFAADIAYHFDKAQRGYTRLVDVWGADHGGYVKRVEAALEAMTGRKGLLDVVLTQMVNLTQGGKQVRMSKRAGTFVTLRDVVDETGADAVRFWFLTRSSGAGLDFDLDLAKSKSNDNPVFYVQYAHARVCSLEVKLRERELEDVAGDLARLTAPEELDLIRLLGLFPETVESAAWSREPHRVTYYLSDLAAAFHGYYNQFRILDEDPQVRGARMALVRATGRVIANGLDLLGVSAPESM
ncbi:MAG: arginine--tRNA ligase [Magnetococcales bacterium]|nr:arginine--tRNA ligase [Magnetococcales bacterium]NGZ06882.1 arginine--tRNA ligase [Magnetococcales bacterium]